MDDSNNLAIQSLQSNSPGKLQTTSPAKSSTSSSANSSPEKSQASPSTVILDTVEKLHLDFKTHVVPAISLLSGHQPGSAYLLSQWEQKLSKALLSLQKQASLCMQEVSTQRIQVSMMQENQDVLEGKLQVFLSPYIYFCWFFLLLLPQMVLENDNH